MIYTHFAAAIVGIALSAIATWNVQAWRYDAQIADTAAQHAVALASANQKALDDTIKMQRTKDGAIKAAEQRARTQAANAAVLRSERDGLRAQLAATTVLLPSASCSSVREYTATLNGLLDQCAGAFEGMAREASGHAADSRLMQEAWPK